MCDNGNTWSIAGKLDGLLKAPSWHFEGLALHSPPWSHTRPADAVFHLPSMGTGLSAKRPLMGGKDSEQTSPTKAILPKRMTQTVSESRSALVHFHKVAEQH